jgi:MFS family permease
MPSQNPYWLAQFGQPDSAVQAGITAAMPGGSLLGSLLTTWLGDKLGRKRTVQLAGVIWVIGAVIQCASVVCRGLSRILSPHSADLQL